MVDFISRARRFVRERFPSAQAAFLGGSAASGNATPTSDLDVLVVLPDKSDRASFVETTTFEGQLMEAFVYGPRTLRKWMHKGRVDRRPVLDRLVADGVSLIDSPYARVLSCRSRDALAAGAPSLEAWERDRRRYALSATLDDLADAEGSAEEFAVAATAWREAGELALLLDRRWIGSGKWLARELVASGDRFGLAAWAAGVPTRAVPLDGLRAACSSVIEAAGGYLQDGFTRGSRPLDA